MKHLLEPVRAVHTRRFILFLIDGRKGCQIDDGIPSNFLPDIRQYINCSEVGRVCQIVLCCSSKGDSNLRKNSILHTENLDNTTHNNR